MLNFEKIILHNFGSYGHAEVDLRNKGFCLVSGRNNYKKDNALSNGSGKSFLWSGICFAITGETISGLRTNLKNINNPDDEDCYVLLHFTAGKDAYEIKRIVAPKSDLKIVKNSADVSGKGLRESEKKLGELLPDLTKDLIASSILIGQGMPNKFSSFSPSGRKDLLEKLTKSDFMVEDIRQRVANRQDELNSKLREYDDSLLLNKSQLNATENDLQAKTSELRLLEKPDFDAQLAATNAVLAALKSKGDELATAQKELEAKLDDANKRLVEITEEKAKELAGELEAYNSAHNELFKEKTVADSAIRSLSAEISRLKAIKDVCPTCGQRIPGAVKPDTSSQEAELATQRNALNESLEKLAKCETAHKEYQKQINDSFNDELVGTQTLVRSLKESLAEKKSLAAKCLSDSAAENEKITKLRYEKDNWDKYYESLEKSIRSLESAKVTLAKAISITEKARDDVQSHIAVVKKMETLTKRDFRGYLLANVIAYMDAKAKDYCETVFGTRELNVYLDGNALDISYCGKMFDNLSGGEKQRVDLILQFAIRDMLIAYFGMGANILVLDEITDFLDKQSCAAIMKLLEKELVSIESVFIVSHHANELPLPIDSEIKVVKDENGISRVL